MQKICPTCKTEKPISEFNTAKKYCKPCHNARNRKWRANNIEKVRENDNLKKAELRQNPEYREKQKLYSKAHYQRNREKIGKKARVNKQEVIKQTRKYVYDFLSQHPCIDCGENRPLRLSFDHVRGKKEITISVALQRGYCLETIIAEIEKCEVRCFNCHFEKTAKDFNFWKVDFVS